MEITISWDNIHKYRNNKFDNIIKIYCTTEVLDKKIIDNFPNLQELNFGHILTKSLELLYNCVNLQILNCTGNEIASLEPLSNCVNLQILNCSDNKITSLEALAKCVGLQKISCGYNEITSLEPLSNCVNLQFLDCTVNKITSLEPLHNFINLQKIYCSSNKIKSLEPLSKCVNLQILYCNINKITTIEPLSSCVNIELLYCAHNIITTIKPLSNFVNLQLLDCVHNQITSLEGLSNCVNLRTLYCNGNQITSLEPLSNCVNLEKLYCHHNQLISLEPLSYCVNLQVLNCHINQITSLEPLIYLRRLNHIDYSDNPIEIPTVQIQRMLNRIQSNCYSSIYNDNHNIHDTEIQRTVCESVQNLLKDPKFDFNINNVINSGLNKSTIECLVEYCQDQTIHSVHLITYQELFLLVWNRIINSNHKTELMRILEEQIAESECKCFTGRFNRTLSVLVGFYDDIKINISDKSRISAIILNSKDKIIPYDAVIHKQSATKELMEAGYQEAEIKDWIDAIDE